MVVAQKIYQENIYTNVSSTSLQEVTIRPYGYEYSKLHENIQDIVEQLYYSEIARIRSLLDEFLLVEILPFLFVKSIYSKYNNNTTRFITLIFTGTTTLDERRKIYHYFSDFQFNFTDAVFDYHVIDLTGRNINDFIFDDYSLLEK